MQRSSRLNRPGLKGSSRVAALLSSEGAGVVLKAEPDTTTSIALAWTESPLKPDNYRIESSGDGSIWSTVTTVSSTVLSYTDTGLIESTQYYYRIVPILGGVDQPPSNVASTWTVPATPSTLTTLVISSSQIDLSWLDVSTGNTGYNIERRTPPTTGTYAVVGTAGATATSFSSTGLSASTQYQFRVTATNPATQSAYSNEASATTNSATIPTAPTGVSASASTTAVAVTITWTDASSDEDGFYVYRNTSNTTTGATQINSVAAGVQTYTDNATNNPANPPAIGTVYYYWVSAYNGAGESTKVAASQNATGGVTTLNVPAAPTSLTATGVSTTQIDLAWLDADATETGFIIERRSPAGTGSYSQIATTAANVQTYSNTGLTESTQYEYRVAATNAAGNSSYSNTASKYTIPATPTGLTATAASSTQINLAWTDVSTGNTGQRIERRSPAGTGSYSTLTTVSATATTYSDTGLTASTQYEYRIIATNPDYDSSPSTSASATTQSGTSTYNVEYLVVAGGGGAARGGGGAGGYRTATGFSLTVGTSYTITVGAGGAGKNSNLGTLVGNNGSNSVFSTITSDGGGGGGGGGTGARNGNSGGSGGGAAHDGTTAGTGGTGTSGQGNNGGSPNTSFLGSPYAMAGGGGASAAGGANTSASVAGNGGDGTASSITGSSVTRAGGGGGGVFSAGGTAGTGGTGGGGAGAVGNGNGTAGTVNTGGGGGGGAGTVGNVGGNGGSGVVILRMPTANYSGTTTGSPTVTTSGSDTILTYNASGTYTA